ncbi:hypothetical protein [Arthrobacter pigmenti]
MADDTVIMAREAYAREIAAVEGIDFHQRWSVGVPEMLTGGETLLPTPMPRGSLPTMSPTRRSAKLPASDISPPSSHQRTLLPS